jgi:hypothetical protein
MAHRNSMQGCNRFDAAIATDVTRVIRRERR